MDEYLLNSEKSQLKHGSFPFTADAKYDEIVYAIYRWMLHQREAYKKVSFIRNKLASWNPSYLFGILKKLVE